MTGADEYCKLFTKAEQHGRLYLIPYYHARGKTFRVFVLPEGEDVIENGGVNPPLNDGTVEVYGAVSGRLGWTEAYGWIHKGAWQEDLRLLRGSRERELQEYKERQLAYAEEREDEKQKRVSRTLSTY